MAMVIAVEAAMVTQGGGGHAGGWRWARCDAGRRRFPPLFWARSPVCVLTKRGPRWSQCYPSPISGWTAPQGRRRDGWPPTDVWGA